MKSYISVTKLSFILVAAICLLSSCNKWHYDYPRVKVDLNQAEPLEQTGALPEVQPVTNQIPADNGVTVIQPTTNEVASVETSVQDQAVPVAGKHTSPVKAKKETKKPFSFIQKLMDDDRLFKVNEVEKSALSGWVRLMIILFVVGFILVLVGIFLSVFLHPGFWWLFYFFGSLCILAGFIVLILGLVGVML